LIGCANLANLGLARAVARSHEVAVRASLGASRWRLVRQFLTETVLLSLAGGVLGIVLGYAMMRWLKTLVPPFVLPREVAVNMDARVLLFALAVSVLTGILFGIAPAVHASTPDLASTMKEGGRSTSIGGGGRRMRDALVVVEVALAFVLLVGSGLLIRSFFGLLHVDPGFDSTNVLTLGLPIAQKQYPEPDRLNSYLHEIRGAIEGVPGVRETALTSALPLRGWGYGMPWQIAGRPPVDHANQRGGFFKIVSPSYFNTLGIRLKKGRALSEHDTKGSLPVAVINETLAKRDFAKEDPIGHRILVQQIVPGKTELGPEIAWEIAGVIADEKINAMDDRGSAGMYVSNEQSPVYGADLIVRASMNPRILERSIRQAVSGVNKDQALSDVKLLEEIKDESLAGDRIESMLLTIFAGVALLLAAIGIYGVISYAVAQRTHEIGIRAALGASRGNVLWLVLLNGLVLTGIGLIIGLGGSLALTRLMSSLLYGVGARDPITLVTVGLVLAAVATMACFLPARKATKVDPMVALRYE
jgi:putative ABC transport system permease protein